MSSALLQQQRRWPQLMSILHQVQESKLRPWENWDAATIASVCSAPIVSVTRNWPLIHKELVKLGIDNPSVQAAAIATIAIETASTFEPVKEAYWMSEAWRRDMLRYYPYYGRGFIQLTWDYNYKTYGELLGVNLFDEPDRALVPAVAAAVLAEYFLLRGVAAAAKNHNWTEVRRLVQGGSDGLTRLVRVVGALGMPV